jgi:hypothetical protein
MSTDPVEFRATARTPSDDRVATSSDGGTALGGRADTQRYRLRPRRPYQPNE